MVRQLAGLEEVTSSDWFTECSLQEFHSRKIQEDKVVIRGCRNVECRTAFGAYVLHYRQHKNHLVSPFELRIRPCIDVEL